MRILFCFAGGIGHFLPLLPIARAMGDAGHTVAFGAQAGLLRTVGQAGFDGLDTGGSTGGDEALRLPLQRMALEREYRVVRDTYAGRIARQRAPAIVRLAAEWKPDLLVCDEMDFGCMVAAEHLALPHASVLVIATGQLTRLAGIGPVLDRLRTDLALAADPGLAMLSRYLVLSQFPASLREPSLPVPATLHAFRPRATTLNRDAQPPAWLVSPRQRPVVYVTLGTVFNVEAGDLLSRVLEGLGNLPLDVVATVGPQIDPAELGPQAGNVRIERYTDQGLLLPYCDLVVAHGGSGTVVGALAHGLPMLLLPMGADQPFNAQRCEALGVARVLDPVDCTVAELRDAVVGLRTGDVYRQAARRVRDEIAALPGQARAMALLVELGRERKPLLTR